VGKNSRQGPSAQPHAKGSTRPEAETSGREKEVHSVNPEDTRTVEFGCSLGNKGEEESGLVPSREQFRTGRVDGGKGKATGQERITDAIEEVLARPS